MTPGQENESMYGHNREKFDLGVAKCHPKQFERLRRGIDTSRLRIRPSAVALTVLVLAGMGMLGPVSAEDGAPDATNRKQGMNALMSENESTVTIEVDCNRSNVELTAPEGYQYDASVTVAKVTPTANDVTRSTLGSVEGNTTVDIEGEGVVFTVVQNRSDDEVTDVADCTDAETMNTTVQPDDPDPTIDIDCENDTVQFDASEGTEYVAKVVVVDVSSTGTSTSSTVQTLEGNATVSTDRSGLVAVYASTGELGDERTVSTIRNCSSLGTNDAETESV
jgi:hypothetical protein